MKPILLSLLSVLALVSTNAQSPLPRRANIIVIVAQGLGAGDLSCYGQTQFQTPNLDKLAAQGVRFTHYSAGSANSSSAMAALLTGRTIGSMAPPNDETPATELGPSDVTLAQLLKDSGYFTSYIGEWDLGAQNSSGAPWIKGFNEFTGFFNSADAQNAYADSFWRYEVKPTDETATMYNGPEQIYANAGGKHVQYVPDWLVVLATHVPRNHVPDKFNHYRPFFLLLDCSIPGNGNRVVPTDAPFSEEAWPQPEKNRAAMISRLDNDVGQIQQYLDKAGLSTNTVMVFTSDTVPRITGGTDPKFFHENASTNSLYVPMIVRWPGTIPAGQVSDQECSARDFLPTLSSIGLVTPPANVEGASLWPTLLGQTQK